MDQSGRVAIVTGAGRGLGAAISRELSKQGVRVALCDVDLAQAEVVAAELRASDVDAAAFGNDISRPPEIERLVQATIKRFGFIFILVKNSAIFS